jgi:hypothetical protein
MVSVAEDEGVWVMPQMEPILERVTGEEDGLKAETRMTLGLEDGEGLRIG